MVGELDDVGTEPLALIQIPPRQEARTIGVQKLFGWCPNGEIGFTANGADRDARSPADKVALGLGTREAGEFDHLVDANLALDEGLR